MDRHFPFFYLVCICVHTCVCSTCGSKNLILSLYKVYSENWTQITRLIGKLHIPAETSSQTFIFPIEEKKFDTHAKLHK